MSGDTLYEMYERLFHHYGPQHWWPAETPFEIMVGAILTQNTNWRNVEKALDALKGAGVLDLGKLVDLPVDLLAAYIRPAGYYNIKAGRLMNLCRTVASFGTVDAFLDRPLEELRKSLLGVKGVGPETADTICLYAAGLPVFVVDTYTCRVLFRHQLIDGAVDYQTVQDFFMDSLPQDAEVFNEYHALLVQVGKDFCRKRTPDCDNCPLKGV
ncbi:MAG: endonuclease [Desulfobulbus propionicus]|nr:MAG: endonuclease [Desulfobulbus propionicus]